jgi:hypothetical protein
MAQSAWPDATLSLAIQLPIPSASNVTAIAAGNGLTRESSAKARPYVMLVRKATRR